MKTSSTPNHIAISVVVPAYNAAPYIGYTLDSILSQSFSPKEIIIVDDGSTDKTNEIVKEYSEKHDHIKLIKQKNQGVAKARNRGLAECTSEWIALLDADDLWFPDKLEKQAHIAATSAAEIGLIYCWSILIDGSNKLFKFQGKITSQGQVWGQLLTECIVTNTSIPLVRKAAIEKLGAFEQSPDQNVKGTEDWAFYLKIAGHYKFALVPEYLCAYRIHQENMSSNPERMRLSTKYLYSTIREKYPKLPGYVETIAKANMYFFLANRSYMLGHYTEYLRLSYKQIFLDPANALRPAWWRMTLKACGLTLLSPLRTKNKTQASTYITRSEHIPIEEIPQRAAQIQGHRSEKTLYNFIYRRRIERLNKLQPQDYIREATKA